jgi:hypothetical protein
MTQNHEHNHNSFHLHHETKEKMKIIEERKKERAHIMENDE